MLVVCYPLETTKGRSLDRTAEAIEIGKELDRGVDLDMLMQVEAGHDLLTTSIGIDRQLISQRLPYLYRHLDDVLAHYEHPREDIEMDTDNRVLGNSVDPFILR